MVGKTNLNNKEETRFFCFIIWIDGKVESYMEPFMPQMQKANTCLYQQCGYIYWIHTVNQAWPPRSRSLKLQSPAGPEDGQQTCWNQGGAGPELALSPYWQPQWATSKSETYPWGSESLLNYLAQRKNGARVFRPVSSALENAVPELHLLSLHYYHCWIFLHAFSREDKTGSQKNKCKIQSPWEQGSILKASIYFCFTQLLSKGSIFLSTVTWI